MDKQFDKILYGNENFIDLCVKGRYSSSYVDDLIKKWHTSNSERELIDCIGMSEEQYSQFTIKFDYIEKLIEEKRNGG